MTFRPNNVSMNDSLCAIIPMRAGSKRVPDKNLRPFAGFEFGLAELKLRQLVEVEEFDEIVVDTDEPRIGGLIEALSKGGIDTTRIRVEPRDDDFATDVATTDSLIRYLGGRLRTTHALWTHVTSPFVTTAAYREAIAQHLRLDSRTHDSLMSATLLKEFIWDRSGPKNYDYSREKWPRTQTLPEWFFVNSGIFLCPSSFYVERGNRIGESPFIFEMDKIQGFDVDWPEDFEMAESLISRNPGLAEISSETR